MKNEKITTTTASILAASQILLLAGCNNCEIKKEHAHFYTSESSYNRYIKSEKKEYENSWEKTEEYIILDKNSKKLLKAEDFFELYRIDLNKDKIEEIVREQSDHLEYRYSFSEYSPNLNYYILEIPGSFPLDDDGGYSWTSNPVNKDLTGETRLAHFMYYAYKLEKDFFGNYKLVRSDLVDSLDELPEEYNYIGTCFYTLVDPDTKEELDYESIDRTYAINLYYGDYSHNFKNEKNGSKKVKVLKRINNE